MTQNKNQTGRGTVFPIVEAYGFPHNSKSPEAIKAQNNQHCPFYNGPCEKKRQYNFGYCSVTYAAKWNNGERRTYAVCDHRLDGPPVKWAITDYFGDRQAILVPEVTAKDSPKLNIDYVAFLDENSTLNDNIIAIETQAIDLRGGGVGPAWEAWEANDVENWREYFTAEAKRKGRRDTVDYGVNTGNVYKRLGTQVAVKGEYLKKIDVPLYVVMQHSILEQLQSRIRFLPVEDGEPWDITFSGFEYNGTFEPSGQLRLKLVEIVRTTLANYVQAMTSGGEDDVLREDFIARAKKKAGTTNRQPDLFSDT